MNATTDKIKTSPESLPSQPAFFHRVGNRLLGGVLVIIMAGLLAVIFLYGQRQEQSIVDMAEDTLGHLADLTTHEYLSLFSRPHVRNQERYFLEKNLPAGVVDFRLVDGSGNDQLKRFPDKSPSSPLPPDQIRKVFSDHGPLRLQQVSKDDRLLTLIRPISFPSTCQECHAGTPERLQRALSITLSIKATGVDLNLPWSNAMTVLVIGIWGCFIIVHLVAFRFVVEPLQNMTEAMKKIADGNMTVRAPVYEDDELGIMSRSFNNMTERLSAIYEELRVEQKKLLTILRGSKEGVIVTDGNQRILLANPSAEALLDKKFDSIVEDGFLGLVGQPDWMRDRLENEKPGDPDTIEYRGRILSVQASTLTGEDGLAIGSGALIRDVTEEERLRAELRKRAETDALTGLFNRRYFDQALEAEFTRHQRYASSCGLMLLDVDHFKRFNDTHGHECGDRVLQAIAKQLQAACDQGLACRYGGEEMVVLLPQYDAEQAAHCAERVRNAVESLVIDGLHVTVSIGVGALSPATPGSLAPSEFLKKIDEALYRAKEQGRNQVEHAHLN